MTEKSTLEEEALQHLRSTDIKKLSEYASAGQFDNFHKTYFSMSKNERINFLKYSEAAAILNSVSEKINKLNPRGDDYFKMSNVLADIIDIAEPNLLVQFKSAFIKTCESLNLTKIIPKGWKEEVLKAQNLQLLAKRNAHNSTNIGAENIGIAKNFKNALTKAAANNRTSYQARSKKTKTHTSEIEMM